MFHTRRWAKSYIVALIGWALVAVLKADEVAEIGGCIGTEPEQILEADPSNYLSRVSALMPGDLLRLAAGTYASGLPIQDLDGEPNRCIIIEGPSVGSATFTGRDCCNTVSIRNSSYLVIRSLELDGQGRLGDGVKAESDSTSAHHITLEDLYIHGHGADQQIVGINTKSPAWNWVIRRNIIEWTGTGIYLGNSDGEDEFVAGLIEHNLIVDSRGYNLQIKHQNGRDTALGMPASSRTIIRHNVFSKAQNASVGGLARPNLLLGHWPLSGAGSDDDYLVYGNFFHQNPTGEGLLQAEGNVIVYANLFLNDVGNAVFIQPHNDVPKRILLARNTLVASGTGLRVTGGDSNFEQKMIGNASFANAPASGGAQSGNVTDSYANAASFLRNPTGGLTGTSNRLDLSPLPGALVGMALDLSDLSSYVDGTRDFAGQAYTDLQSGAYADDSSSPPWLPSLERKPDPNTIFQDGFDSGTLSAWTSSSGG